MLNNIHPKNKDDKLPPLGRHWLRQPIPDFQNHSIDILTMMDVKGRHYKFGSGDSWASTREEWDDGMFCVCQILFHIFSKIVYSLPGGNEVVYMKFLSALLLSIVLNGNII